MRTTREDVWLAVYLQELARLQKDEAFDTEQAHHAGAGRMAALAVQEFDARFPRPLRDD